MTPRKTKNMHICPECGAAKGFGYWNEVLQKWEIANTFDKGSFCENCGSDVFWMEDNNVEEG